VHADWDFGPATSLVLGASAGALLLFGAGWLVATHPRWRRPVRDIPAEKVTRALLFRRFLHARLDPASATGLALTVALAVIFLAALAFGMLSDMIASHTGLARLDAGAAAWGARHATRQSTRVLGWLTLLGSTLVVSLLGAVAAVVDWARRHRVAAAGFLLTVIAGQNLIANGVKLLVRRARPPVPHLAAATGFSFPSGHTASAAATYAALALLAGSGRHWRTRVWLWTAAAAVAAAKVASRLPSSTIRIS
jgi:undecaprenyl-diphosphatase